MGIDNQRDLVLPPLTFAFVLDGSKGIINTYVGPTKTTLSEQDRAVRHNPSTNKFDPSPSLSEAIQPFVAASEGSYIVLQNPVAKEVSEKNAHPTPSGNGQSTPTLDYGRTVNIRGPINFSLWPSQIANVVPGHILRSNQYLLCRVYNAEAAREHWNSQVTAPSANQGADGQKQTPAAANAPTAMSGIDVTKLVTGQLLIMKGTEISFYIPPTGIEVLKGEENSYVQSAVTLERLEYCILVDENGEKRIEQGPQVVFPKPTERFMTRSTDTGNTRRFLAYSLSRLQALHLQVVADYNDDGSTTDPELRKKEGLELKAPDHRVGDEIVIFGKDQPIYFPRSEHAVLKYGESEIYNSVAIPKGDARYVMNRLTGDIRLVRGPTMLLPDPRTEILVRRILTTAQVALWFPGNNEAAQYNADLASLQKSTDAGGQAFITERMVRSTTSSSYGAPSASPVSRSSAGMLESFSPPGAPAFANTVNRGTTYVPPRSINLESSKYEGAVNISPHTGYAIQVVSKTGERKVVVGPATHLLEHDETLEAVALSTGKPKTTDRLERTVYLQVQNNCVSDVLGVETADMVQVQLKLSYRVNFEGDRSKWFSVSNYVKLLCDHIRSRMRNMVKGVNIDQFYAEAIPMIRDCILGVSKEGVREGLSFDENGMRVYDVEVLGVVINDSTIQQMLGTAMVDTFRNNMDLEAARRRLQTTTEIEAITRQSNEQKAATERQRFELEVEKVKAQLLARQAEVESELTIAKAKLEVTRTEESKADISTEANLARQKKSGELLDELENAKNARDAARERAKTQSDVTRLTALKDGLGSVLLSISADHTMEVLAKASAPMSILGGDNIVEVLHKLFVGTPFASVLTSLATNRLALPASKP